MARMKRWRKKRIKWKKHIFRNPYFVLSFFSSLYFLYFFFFSHFVSHSFEIQFITFQWNNKWQKKRLYFFPHLPIRIVCTFVLYTRPDDFPFSLIYFLLLIEFSLLAFSHGILHNTWRGREKARFHSQYKNDYAYMYAQTTTVTRTKKAMQRKKMWGTE